MNATNEFWTALQSLQVASQIGTQSDYQEPSMRQICLATAEYFNVPYLDMMGRKRRSDLVNARRHAMFACLKFTRNGYSNIGRFFDRDHSTVMYSEKEVNKVLHTNKDVVTHFLEYIEGVAKIH